MKYICFTSLSIFATLTIVLALSLVDILNLPEDLRGIFGIIDIIALGLFFKSYIRIYKYTHRD